MQVSLKLEFRQGPIFTETSVQLSMKKVSEQRMNMDKIKVVDNKLLINHPLLMPIHDPLEFYTLVSHMCSKSEWK